MNDTPPDPSPAPSVPVAGQHTVLLIDDQAMVAEAVRRMLAPEANITFHYCGDPMTAVDVANQVRPTLILQDLVMPNLNGLALVKRFRANPQTRATPIIVLTTKDSPMFKQDATASGANDYMVKLPSREDLITRIRVFSGEYLAQLQREGRQP